MKRVWLVVDTRTGSAGSPPLPLPKLLEDEPDRFWRVSTEGVNPSRRTLLHREADLLLVDATEEILVLAKGLPYWEFDRGEFQPVHFKGTLEDLSDPAFESLNRLLGDPAPSLEAVGESARERAKAKRNYELLGEAALLANLAPYGIAATASLVVAAGAVATVLEQVVILTAFVLAILLKRSTSKIRWTEGRAVREVWRSLKTSGPWIDPVNPVQARVFPRYRGLLRTLLAPVGSLAIPAPEDWRPAKTAYLQDRIDRQIGYFQESAAKADRSHSILRNTFLATSIVAAVCALATLAKEAGLLPGYEALVSKWFEDFGSSVFPGVSAWCLGYVGLSGTKRRAGLYRQMTRRFVEIRHGFEVCGDNETFAELVNDTEALLLEEVAGWMRRSEF